MTGLHRPLFALALATGLSFGLACDKSKSSGSQTPGEITAIQGPEYCPRSVPARGDACPRGNSDFCIYRTTTTDFACVCGKGVWNCAAK